MVSLTAAATYSRRHTMGREKCGGEQKERLWSEAQLCAAVSWCVSRMTSESFLFTASQMLQKWKKCQTVELNNDSHHTANVTHVSKSAKGIFFQLSNDWWWKRGKNKAAAYLLSCGLNTEMYVCCASNHLSHSHGSRWMNNTWHESWKFWPHIYEFQTVKTRSAS